MRKIHTKSQLRLFIIRIKLYQKESKWRQSTLSKAGGVITEWDMEITGLKRIGRDLLPFPYLWS